jgi:GTP-binding protein
MTNISTHTENGRHIFAGEWHFVAAANSLASIPPMHGIEIAFAGRSNVGKSSLINALTSRKALARVSHTPGRTQELIFFDSNTGLTLVDMPGYGYATVAKSTIAAWTELTQAYFTSRANLARVYVLIDARRGLKATDTLALDALSRAAVSHQIVLTKTDAVKASELADCVNEVEKVLALRSAALPGVLLSSAHEKTGITEFRAAVARLLAECNRGHITKLRRQ